MSYNLLFDTNFKLINKNKSWKLINCVYKNGYLRGNSTIYSIEQELILPQPTKLYLGIDYLCLDSNIKSIKCEIFHQNNLLNSLKIKPKYRKKKRFSLIDQSLIENIRIVFTVESGAPNSNICICKPFLIDLIKQGKDTWPKIILDKILNYKEGYSYCNEYFTNKISLENEDFSSLYTETKEAEEGILAIVKEKDWFKIKCDFKLDNYYLVKINFNQLNNYGNMYLTYGENNSISLDRNQIYIIFKANNKDELKLILENFEEPPYLINLKNILIINLKNLKIEEEDIQYLPFI